jgi:hypothetical protein
VPSALNPDKLDAPVQDRNEEQYLDHWFGLNPDIDYLVGLLPAMLAYHGPADRRCAINIPVGWLSVIRPLGRCFVGRLAGDSDGTGRHRDEAEKGGAAMSFMDEAREQMEEMREEAHRKLAEAEAEHGADEHGVVTSDDGTTRGTSWSEHTVEVHETP